MFALKAAAAKREEGVLGRAEFFTVAIVGGKCGGCGVFNIEPAFCHFLAARKNSVFRSGDYFDVMAADQCRVLHRARAGLPIAMPSANVGFGVTSTKEEDPCSSVS